MSSPKGMHAKIPLPVLPVKPRQTIPVPKLIKPNAFKLTVPPPSLSGRTFKKLPSPSQQIPSNMKLSPPMINKSPTQVYAQAQDKSVSLTKRYPQSFTTIGNKKFVVLPKKARPDITSAQAAAAVGNGMGPRICYVGNRPDATRKLEIVPTVRAQNNVLEGASSQNPAKGDTESKTITDTTNESQNEIVKANDEVIAAVETDASVNNNVEVANSSTESVSVANQ